MDQDSGRSAIAEVRALLEDAIACIGTDAPLSARQLIGTAIDRLSRLPEAQGGPSEEQMAREWYPFEGVGAAPASVHPATAGEWRWVPVEATEAMEVAGRHAYRTGSDPATVEAEVWDAMLAACPSSPLQDEALVERVAEWLWHYHGRDPALPYGGLEVRKEAREIIALIAPSRVGGEAATEERVRVMRSWARELRENANGNPDAITEAAKWERAANAAAARAPKTEG